MKKHNIIPFILPLLFLIACVYYSILSAVAYDDTVPSFWRAFFSGWHYFIPAVITALTFLQIKFKHSLLISVIKNFLAIFFQLIFVWQSAHNIGLLITLILFSLIMIALFIADYLLYKKQLKTLTQ